MNIGMKWHFGIFTECNALYYLPSARFCVVWIYLSHCNNSAQHFQDIRLSVASLILLHHFKSDFTTTTARTKLIGCWLILASLASFCWLLEDHITMWMLDLFVGGKRWAALFLYFKCLPNTHAFIHGKWSVRN